MRTFEQADVGGNDSRPMVCARLNVAKIACRWIAVGIHVQEETGSVAAGILRRRFGSSCIWVPYKIWIRRMIRSRIAFIRGGYGERYTACHPTQNAEEGLRTSRVQTPWNMESKPGAEECGGVSLRRNMQS